ncbi:HECT-domain-containing protein [Diplocarpon rosae]|nr:HECT-domain-containing protein [Diplocarpon rosae]
MTRDTRRVYDDRDTASDAEIYAALWATVPFSRLPEDAPNELKRLTINVDDPKRIYGIHRARRRHNFQLLVERYILQIRYGCQSKTCTKTTCFSCRKRAANGAPVRRYNSSSARTLAIYMASQDNPERGLCHYASVGRVVADVSKPLKPKPVFSHGGRTSPVALSPSRRTDGKQTLKTAAFVEDLPGADEKIKEKVSADNQKRRARNNFAYLEEPSTIDHRSFVQNLFGTVAFKMIEWLTPRNLGRLASLQDKPVTSDDKSSTTHDEDLSSGAGGSSLSDVGKSSKLVTDPDCDARDEPVSVVPATENEPQPSSFPIVSADGALSGTIVESRPHSVHVPQTFSSPNLLKRSDSAGSRRPKSIVNKPTKPSEVAGDPLPPPASSLVQRPTAEPLRQTLIASPKMRNSSVIHSSLDSWQSDGNCDEGNDTNPQTYKVNYPPAETKAEPVERPKFKSNEKPSETPERKHSQLAPEQELNESTSPVSLHERVLLPQSMSSLSIETIELLCDVMQTDGTCENHLLQPQTVSDSLKRFRPGMASSARSSSSHLPSHSPRLKRDWHGFTEQSFFDVLGKPDSLLKSFSDDESKLFDTQTTWYLLFRMTRVAPSLVFDRLWEVAGTLFRPPETLELAHEWARDQNCSPRGALSNNDAARVINICLHALVAAAPLTSDARQLANMSRIRSYGLALLGKASSSLEPTELCLQYEDAFTDEPAFRLARRLFAAIPTRRSFTELVELQKDIRNDDNRESDILEVVLESLKFLDLGTLPILEFSDDERAIHEKRVPTLILDWARTVMLQEWDGSARVPNDGPFGGALAMIAAIYKNRKSLLLGDIHFRTEYFAERMDPVDMPLEWLSFGDNKRIVHLLDYPWLFNPATLVTYFRAINYSKMNQSYEKAQTTGHLVHHFIQEGSLITDKSRKDKLRQRLRTATSEFMVLEVRRSNVLLDTFNAIWRREERELMRPLKIRLGEEGGEQGLDSGGVQQEFFRLAIAEALDPDYGTFTIDARTKMTWFQPGSPEPLWKFQLIGMIVSLAVYNGLTLPVTFPKALYRKLLGEEVTELHHIADGWPELTNGLTTLLEWDEKDGLVEDIFARTYEFSVEQFGQPISRDMGVSTQWPSFSELQTSSNPTDAPSVTNENRNSYVSDYIRWLTDVSIRPQFEAFKKGFFSCIDCRSVALFDPETLQSVVEGIQEIDISELRRATRYTGWDASHRSIRDFWSIVKRYDLEQKRKLLEFVTASDRVPVGGMRNLHFTVQRNGINDGDDSHLPSSYTCYGILLLPEYSTKDVLRQKLAMALDNSKGFGMA